MAVKQYLVRHVWLRKSETDILCDECINFSIIRQSLKNMRKTLKVMIKKCFIAINMSEA